MIIVNFVLVGFIILLLPLFLQLKAIVDVNAKRGYYSFRLFKFIKINMGYVTIDNKFIYIHYSKKKAIAINYKKAKPNKTLMNEIKALDIFKFQTKIIIQTEDLPKVYGFMAMIDVIYQTIAKIISTYKPYMQINNQTIIVEEKNTLSLMVEIKFMFCILTITLKALVGVINNIFKEENNAKKQAKAN